MTETKAEVLVVVDMQNDFITGSLGSEAAQAIVPNVVEKVKAYKDQRKKIITTQDTHYSDYLNTLEGEYLPIEHCKINSDGWQIEDEVYNCLRNYNKWESILKPSFGSLELVNKIKELVDQNPNEIINIEVLGLLLNICVISNIMLLKSIPNCNIFVDLNCVAASSDKLKESSVSILESCQVNII